MLQLWLSMPRSGVDVAIIGAGPNGLTAAATLALAGCSVLVLEHQARIGGGCRTDEVTLPGFVHDLCSAIHPMGAASPIFRRLDLERHGVEWMSSPLALAHPFDDSGAAVLSQDMRETVESLGGDGASWQRLLQPLVDRRDELFSGILRPIRFPRQPLLMARFGQLALRSARAVAGRFHGPAARALFAGNAAHSGIPLEAPGSAAAGLVLAIAGHAVGWPCARGGSHAIGEALAARARSAGCTIETSVTVRSLRDVPDARAILFDLTPRQVDRIAGERLSPAFRRQLQRYRYGAGAFKIDYALSDRIPWRASRCAEAATVHVGGSFEEIARSEADANGGRAPGAPFVLVAQQSLVDATRAPAGRHTGWAYCHVPNGSAEDMTERIERQIERFAPGFRDTILARSVSSPAALELRNPNLVGGDVGGGAATLVQTLLRPSTRWNPYTTSSPRLFLCSSSTPPGAGVHGMCGYWGARTVLRWVFGRDVPEEFRL